MKLKDYIEKYGTPISVLARKANMKECTLIKIFRGSEPTLKSAIAIEDATRGEVTIREMVRPEGELSPSQRAREKIAKKDYANAEK